MAHTSVLLKEVIDGLELKAGDIYLDATAGSGGHMEEVWLRMKEAVTAINILTRISFFPVFFLLS